MNWYNWFNASAPMWRLGGLYLRLWNVFNRQCADGDHYWGVGVLQIGHRHLAYVGHSGWSVLWVGQVP